MTVYGYVQIGLYLVVLLALARPLGTYMAAVYEGRSIGLTASSGRSSAGCIVSSAPAKSRR